MPAPIGSYASFLKLLLTIGPKLKTLWPKLQALIAAFTDVVDALKALAPQPSGPEPGTLAFTEAPADVEETATAEAEVAALIAGHDGFFDVATIRLLWQLAQALPSLFEAFEALAKGG